MLSAPTFAAPRSTELSRHFRLTRLHLGRTVARPRLLDRIVLVNLLLDAVPGDGFQLTYLGRRFAAISATSLDGPTLERWLDRLQIYPRR